jgi:hypothetical protein
MPSGRSHACPTRRQRGDVFDQLPLLKGSRTFHLVTLGEQSKVLARKKFSRKQLLAYTANLPTSLSVILVDLALCANRKHIVT